MCHEKAKEFTEAIGATKEEQDALDLARSVWREARAVGLPATRQV